VYFVDANIVLIWS